MSKLKITGYGDELTINNVRLGDLSPQDHENIEKERVRGKKYREKNDIFVLIFQ